VLVRLTLGVETVVTEVDVDYFQGRDLKVLVLGEETADQGLQVLLATVCLDTDFEHNSLNKR